MAPSQSQCSCSTHLPLPEGSWQPQRSPRILPPLLPALDAVRWAQTPCWFQLQRPRWPGLEGAMELIQSFKMLPQTFSTSVGLSTRFTISHPKSPVPGEGLRGYRNIPPPAQGCFLSSADQTALRSSQNDTQLDSEAQTARLRRQVEILKETTGCCS